MTMTIETPHAAGKEPRTGRHLTLRAGVVALPLQVYLATDDHNYSRSQFTPDGHPVGNLRYDKETGEPYDGEIMKRAQTSDGEWVDLSDEEIAAAVGAGDDGEAKVVCFIPLETIGSIYLPESWHQARPQKRKVKGRNVPDPVIGGAFNTFCAGMAAEGVAALVEYGTSKGPRYAALLPDARWVTLCFAEQVRIPLPLPESLPADDDIELVRELIRTIGIDNPVLTDIATPKLDAIVEAKATGQAVPVAIPASSAPVSSLADALRASIKEAKAERRGAA